MNSLTERALFFAAGIAFGILIGVLFASAPDAPAPVAASAGGAAPSAAAPGPDRAPAGPDRVDPDLLESLVAQVESRPDDPQARADVGEIHLQARDFTQAVYWFQQARNLDPSDLEIQVRLAFAYLGQGQVGRAAEIYEVVLAADPEHLLALIGLGQIRLFAEQDLEAGIALWERAIAAHPESEEADALRARLSTLQEAHP